MCITFNFFFNPGLSLSLFERLVNSGVEPLLLDTQYRMHPAISQFPSDCFYGGAIQDGIDANDRPLLPGFDWPRSDFPVAFVPIENGVETTDGMSKINRMEANVRIQATQEQCSCNYR